MKKITIILTLILFIASVGIQAQKVINPVNAKINFEELRLKGNNANTFKIGDSYNQMVAALGSPTSQQDFYFEMSEVSGMLYLYGSNRLYFKLEEFDAWELKDQSISLGRNGKYFKLGDTVDKVYEVFPEYSNKPVQNGYIDIHLRSVNYDMECTRIIIHFDGNNKVSEIMRHDC